MTLITPTRIVIVGGGGREHALAWKLAGEPGVNEVVVAPGSDAIAREPKVRSVPGVDPLDPPAVLAVARSVAAELVVIGPEGPLAAGVGDTLDAAGFAVFGPSAAAAMIESSKTYCHDVAAAAGVRMAESGAFTELGPAIAFARDLAARGDGVVVKADGLAAGKGVTVCDDVAEAERALGTLDAARREAGGGGDAPFVVVEDRLRGPEASVIALCDGGDLVALPIARDHKRLLDGDRGPNTGGMGAVSPVSDFPDGRTSEIVETVHRPILAELARRGRPFRGALYAGLILTDGGPVLLECNARFGDPEAQVILPRLAGALGPLLLAAARGDLATVTRGRIAPADPRLPTLRGASVGIVLAADGYPDVPRRGDAIDGLEDASSSGALIFHAGTAIDADGIVRTAGGRVLTVVGRGADVPDARSVALEAVARIHGSGLQHRTDIGVRPMAAHAGVAR
jgi:phosphoribosylamine--glycine ligase